MAKLYDYILTNKPYSEAIRACEGLDWMEINTTEGTTRNLQYYDTFNGIDIYYSIGSDTWVFGDATND